MKAYVTARNWRIFFSGLIWLIVVNVLTILVAVVVGVIAAIHAKLSGQELQPEQVEKFLLDGDFMSIIMLISLPLTLGVIAPVIRWRRQKKIREYLAIKAVSIKAFVPWIVIAASLIGLEYIFNIIFDRSEHHKTLCNAMATADNRLLFLVNLILVVPVIEEVLYRGYVLQCWIDSKIPQFAAIVLLSLLWIVPHCQYDLYDMAWLFLGGIVLAYSRIRSGSLLVPLTLHCFWNAIASLHLGAHLVP